MSDWKSWLGMKDAKARDGLIHMLGVCVGDCELMAKAGREALDALNKSESYWSVELEAKVADALGTMDNYMVFPLETLQGAMDDWQSENDTARHDARVAAQKRLAKAEALAEAARAEVERLR
jgi:hypothetical protein